jgi:hypothetical protein
MKPHSSKANRRTVEAALSRRRRNELKSRGKNIMAKDKETTAEAPESAPKAEAKTDPNAPTVTAKTFGRQPVKK